MKNNLLLAGALTATALTMLGTTETQAQARRNTNFIPYSEVGLGVGTSSYYGELAGYRKPLRSTFLLMRWNAGLMYTRHFTPRLAGRASFTWARITGDDYTYSRNDVNTNIAQYIRNLHFRNDLKEFALTGIYKFVPDGRNTNFRAKLSPYVFAGIGLVAHSPEARTPVDYAEAGEVQPQRWVKLQPLGTEGQGQPRMKKPYPLVALVVPVGFGVRYKFNNRIDLAAEIGYRFTNTDYLDDVGGPYADPTILKSPLAVAMANRTQEPIAARKGGDRTQALIDYLQTQGITTTNPYAELGGLNTGSIRGAKGILNDGYLIGSLQVHYVLMPRIKCPPIK